MLWHLHQYCSVGFKLSMPSTYLHKVHDVTLGMPHIPTYVWGMPPPSTEILLGLYYGQFHQGLQGARLLSCESDTGKYRYDGKDVYLSLRSGILKKTSSHMCDTWYFPMFLLRKGSLTLINIDP